jgi:hypothetical protein
VIAGKAEQRQAERIAPSVVIPPPFRGETPTFGGAPPWAF